MAMGEIIKRKVELTLKEENVLEKWKEASFPALRNAMIEYKAYCGSEWRKVQEELRRVTEQRDLVAREVLKLRKQISEIKQTLAIKE